MESVQKRILVGGAILLFLAVAAGWWLIKNPHPLSLTEKPLQSLSASASSTPSSQGYSIAFFLEDGVYTANADGKDIHRVYSCPIIDGYWGMDGKPKCFGVNWLKDGRILTNIFNGKTICGKQDCGGDSDIVIIDPKTETAKRVVRPEGYREWAPGNSFKFGDPLALSKKDSTNPSGYAYFWYNPDTQAVTKFEKTTIENSGENNYFYLSADSPTYDYSGKSEHIPNAQGDILLINQDNLCEVGVYNIYTKQTNPIISGCNGQQITIVADKTYEMTGRGWCTLASNSAWVACSMGNHISDGWEGTVILLVNTRSGAKTFISSEKYPGLGDFKFSPDNEYLYTAEMGSQGTSGTTDVYRYRIADGASDKVLSSIRVTGNATGGFVLSPLR